LPVQIATFASWDQLIPLFAKMVFCAMLLRPVHRRWKLHAPLVTIVKPENKVLAMLAIFAFPVRRHLLQLMERLVKFVIKELGVRRVIPAKQNAWMVSITLTLEQQTFPTV
jgi:hypothetical protein